MSLIPDDNKFASIGLDELASSKKLDIVEIP